VVFKPTCGMKRQSSIKKFCDSLITTTYVVGGMNFIKLQQYTISENKIREKIYW